MTMETSLTTVKFSSFRHRSVSLQACSTPTTMKSILKERQGPNLRRHGDAIERLGNGFETEPWLPGAKYRVLGRVDDTMNLSGIKVSAAEIEEVLNIVNGVQETAAVAVSPKDGGPSQLIIYTVLAASNAEVTKQKIHTALQTALSEHLNPLFRIHDVVIVDTLPRTASNKILRRLLRARNFTKN